MIQGSVDSDYLGRMLEEIENLPPEAKEEYYRLVVSQVVRANPGGVTVTDICGLTGFDRRTVGQHLSFLVAVREAYKEVIAPRTAKYYPNGKLVHGFDESTVKVGETFFTFRRLLNQFGEFVYVQEKKRDSRNLRSRPPRETIRGRRIIPPCLRRKSPV